MSWMEFENAKNDKEQKETFGEDPKAPHKLRYDYTVETFKRDCVLLLQDMRNTYAHAFESDDCVLEILIGLNTGSEAKLYYLDSAECLPLEIKEAEFIGQSHLVEIFKKAWVSSMNMASSAKLGAFAIKYVETADLSKSVGVGINGKMQIWIIPDGKHPSEVAGEVLDRFMVDVTESVNKFYREFNSLFRS